MRFVTTDPRSAGLADTVGKAVALVSGGTMTTLVKVAAADTAWASVDASVVPAPMESVKCPAVATDPRTGSGRSGNVGDVVLYYTGGAGTYLIKYGVANTSWVPLPDLTTRPSGSGTAGRSTRWVGTRVLGDGAFEDDGTNATIAGLLTVKPAASATSAAAAANTLVTIENSAAAYVTFKSTAAKGLLMNNASGAGDGALVYDDTATPRGWQFRTAGVTQGVFSSAGSFIVGATALTKSTLGLNASEFTRDADSGFAVSAYGAAVTPEIMVFRGRGTGAASSAVQSGDLLGQYAFTGMADGTTHFSGVLLRGYATENWSTGPSRCGTKLEIWTTPNTGVLRSLAFTVDQDGKTIHASKASAAASAGGMRYSGSVMEISNATTWERVATQSATTFTSGSVIFATTGGLLHQDNAQFFWDDSNNRLGIGTTSPAGSLGINTGAAPATSQVNIRANNLGALSVLNFGADNVSVGFDIDRTGGVWVARDTSVAHLYKLGDKLSIYGSGGHVVGNTVAAITERFGVDLLTGAVNIPGSLAVTGAITENGVAVLSGAITANTIPKGSGGNLADSLITDNGTTVTVSAALAATGSTTFGDAAGDVMTVNGSVSFFGAAAGSGGYMYMVGDEFNWRYGDNSEQTGYINKSGYAGGVTQFRNLVIGDGKGGTVALFTGSTKATALAGALSVNGNVTLGDAVSDTHSIFGTTFAYGPASGKALWITSGANAQPALDVTNSNASQTSADVRGLQVYFSGSADTTAAASTHYALLLINDTSRAAGANGLTNIGGYFSASNAQSNIALYTALGDNQFNVNGGSSTFNGPLVANGSVALGNAAADTIAFHGAAGVAQQTVTGSRGGNAALADLLTKLANLGLIVDGTTA